jgi:putative PIN family toxin of toxin-antitoxin system
VRLVIDTNVLVSALFSETSLPAHLVTLWREGRFDLVMAAEQLAELGRVTRYPKIRERIAPALAGRLVNELRDLAVMVGELPTIDASPDPSDNYLLAMAATGKADFLVTGDKRDLLALGSYAGSRIVTVRDFLTHARRLP